MQADWITLATFDHRRQGQSLAALLKDVGVESRVEDERSWQRFWFMAPPQAGVHVRVPEGSLTVAREYLKTNSEGRALFRASVKCPSCGSGRIQFPQMNRKSVMPTLVARGLVLLRLMDLESYCEDCHHTWVPGRPARPGSSRSLSQTP